MTKDRRPLTQETKALATEGWVTPEGTLSAIDLLCFSGSLKEIIESCGSFNEKNSEDEPYSQILSGRRKIFDS